MTKLGWTDHRIYCTYGVWRGGGRLSLRLEYADWGNNCTGPALAGEVMGAMDGARRTDGGGREAR